MPDNRLQDSELISHYFSIGAFVWYTFKPDSNILYIYSRQVDEAVLDLFKSKGTVNSCRIAELRGVQ